MNLVLCGGGPNGLIHLGVLDVLPRMKFKAVWAVSAGAIFASMVGIGVPVEAMIDYIIKRPLNKWVKFNLATFSEMKGLITTDLFDEILMPIFLAYDIDPAITIEQVHARYGVELHLFTVDASSMQLVDVFDMKTVPLMRAIMMSMAVFPLFSPIEYEGRMYIDGAFRCNFPIKQCLQAHAPDTVVAINFSCNLPPIMPETTVWSMMSIVLLHAVLLMADHASNHEAAGVCRYYLKVEVSTALAANAWTDFIESEDHRAKLIEVGRQQDVKNWFKESNSGLAS